MSEPRCAECLMPLAAGRRTCAGCGTPRGILGKSFASEVDPWRREQMWNAAHAARIEKAEPEPEMSQAEQAWSAVRESVLSAPAFIAKAHAEPEPAPTPDPWSAVVASITNEQAGA